MITFTTDEKNLLADTIELCLKNKIKVRLLAQKTFKRSAGSVSSSEFISCFDFNVDDPSFNWEIFTHESCHVDQLLDKKSIWHDIELQTDVDWLSVYTKGKTRKSKKIERYFKKLLELELDCEKRTVKKIKKYNLPINISNYIKNANTYLFSYYCFYHQKCWYDSSFGIFNNPAILDNMPSKYLTLVDYWTKNDLMWNYFKTKNSN